MRSSRPLLAPVFASLVLASCGGAAPPAPPPVSSIPVYPGPSERKKAHDADAKPSFAELRDRVVDAWLAAEPSLARSVGLHDGDGKIADYSAGGIRGRIATLEQTARDLAAVDASTLSPDEALDLAILKGQVDLALFHLVDLDEWERRPQFYEELFAVDEYVNRDYAPIEERQKRLVAHEEAALASVPNVVANLKSPMSKPVLETAVKIFSGYADYLRGDVVKLFGGVGDEAARARFAKVNGALADQAQKIADHLRAVEVPKGDQSHVLGRERFEKLLRVQEGLTMSLADFEKMGEDDLAANRKAYLAQKPKAKPTRPKAADLLGEAGRVMEASRAFIEKNGIATIPTDDRAKVKETPPYMRWNSAFLDAPGAFESAKEAFYYITRPDPSWPKKEQADYIMPRGILLSTTVHEVYPGHYLQGQWLRRAPTRAQKIFGSYSFIEGWAHYGEQLMIEQGFGKEDPQNALGQLSDALLRNCRLVVSLGVHTKGMTLAAAEERFEKDCFQDKATAREQAVRATFDPGYFAYTLGKLQILALRKEAKEKLGARFDLRRFHDELLSHGAPPVPLVRERVLADLEHASATPAASR